MSNDLQSPPEILGSPSLRMILKRIDGFPDIAAPAATSLEHQPPPSIKILDHAVWDLAAWHPAAWHGALPEMSGPNSRLAVAFGGGFVIPLLLGIGFVSSMISGPPLAARVTHVDDPAAVEMSAPLQRVEAFAAPDFFESAWTMLPVPTLPPARDANRVEVVNGVMSPITQIRVAVSTEFPIGPAAAPSRIEAQAAPASVAVPVAKIPKLASPTVVRSPVPVAMPEPSYSPSVTKRKPEPRAPLAVATVDPVPAKTRPVGTTRIGESWINAWHRSTLGMTQQSQ